MDPRAKLAAAFLLLIAVMALPWGPGLWIAAGLTLLASAAARLPVARAVALFLALGWMFLLTVLVHGFTTPGHLIWEVPGLGWSLTREGLLRGTLFAGRLTAMTLVGGAVAVSTDPMDAMRALESFLMPLRRLGIPVGMLSLTFIMALRFVPTLYREAQLLRKALLARGWSSGKGVGGRVKAWIPLIIPLLASGLRRSDTLAATLVVRGYDPYRRRGALYPPRWRPRETGVVLAAALPLLLAAAL